ncbi:MAG: GvpL/GvpF family gas vesicle protein [Chloroflexi bacterium]|nr:GvpL/GvpF family gas vesicle protein [Chloroflexota bacterium]
MGQLGRYLYCIIPCSEERAFDGAVPIGDGSGPIYTIPNAGLATVVSDSAVGEYESTRANLLAHERVQERVMRDFALLPVRFSTVAGPTYSGQDIRRLLEKRSREFAGLLAEVEGKSEFGLKALWKDAGLPFEEIVAQNESIRRLRASLQGKPPLATHFERVRLGEMVKQALDRKRSTEAAQILAPLRAVAHRTVENKVLMDRMIVNAAFLVAKERTGEFDELISRLDAELGQRVVFKYVGPTPPYNFINITVNWSEL